MAHEGIDERPWSGWARRGMAGPGMARLGQARRGKAWAPMAHRGEDKLAWSG